MTAEEEIAARTYQYKHGDRPLDGYTIQRAAGRGGFGEVYYAISDGGREVALKLVLTWQQIELRGISQCMNVKSPQLVTIFDVKYGTDGRPWVIMEYVNGPSLRDLIDASPAGLGTAKSAFFLREIGKGLTYLHDCGIVHRDLKPGNIFFENGCVKIGDYGLSKAMSMSQHSGQTVAVGTLHYMAPEIGEGRYDRTIDIYALGALLFEMLTGKVPFFGSSVAEVLMKHLNSEVNPDGIEEPFQSVIRKSMAKNPADRYQSVQEMVEAVYGSDYVRNSVSQFSPNSLSQVAGRAAPKAGNDGTKPFEVSLDGLDERIAAINERVFDKVQKATEKAARSIKRTQDRIARKYKIDFHLGDKPAVAVNPIGPTQPDALPRGVRILLAFVAMCVAAFATAVLASGEDAGFNASFTFLAIPGALLGANLVWRFVGTSLNGESKWVQRLALGAPAAFGAALFTFPWWVSALDHQRHMGVSISACFAAFALMDWELRLSPSRKDRLHIGLLFTSGLCAFVFAALMDGNNPFAAVAPVVGASAAASVLSRWGPRQRPAYPPQAYTPFSPQPPMPPQPFSPPVWNEQTAIPTPTSQTAETTKAKQRAKWIGRATPLIPLAVCYTVFCATPGDRTPQRALFLVAGVIACFFIFKNSNKKQAASIEPGFNGSSIGGMAAHAARVTFSFAASMLLMITALLALSVTTDLPALLSSGVVNPRIPHDLNQAFGTPDWPRMMNQGATAIGLVTGTLCLMFSILARRHGGGLHIIRGVLGVVIFLAAVVILGRSLPDLGEINQTRNVPAMIDHYVQQVPFSVGLKASCELLLSALLLGWPASRQSLRAAVAAAPAPKLEPVS